MQWSMDTQRERHRETKETHTEKDSRGTTFIIYSSSIGCAARKSDLSQLSYNILQLLWLRSGSEPVHQLFYLGDSRLCNVISLGLYVHLSSFVLRFGGIAFRLGLPVGTRSVRPIEAD